MATAGQDEMLVKDTAGLVAGALSMAAGDYVSVSLRSDTEAAELARERTEPTADPVAEHADLAKKYIGRGLPDTASEVAAQLMAHDALGAHARDELAITEHTTARPSQAAVTLAATFTAGGALPLLLVMIVA